MTNFEEMSKIKEAEILRLQRESNSKTEKIIHLREVNNRLQDQIIDLSQENNRLKDVIIDLHEENNRQKVDIIRLHEVNNSQQGEINELREQIRVLQQMFQILEEAGATRTQRPELPHGSTFTAMVSQRIKKLYDDYAVDNKMYVFGRVVVCIVGSALIINYGPAVYAYVLSMGISPTTTGFGQDSLKALLATLIARMKSG